MKASGSRQGHGRRPRRSLFRRILVTMLVAAVAVAAIMGGLFRAAFGDKGGARMSVARLNLEAYARSVVREADDHDAASLPAHLASLAEQRRLSARVLLPDGSQVTTPGIDSTLPAFGDVRHKAPWSSEGMEFGFARGAAVAVVSSPESGRRYLFALQGLENLELREEYLALSASLLLLVIAFLYWRVRRMLLPLRSLQSGVEALASGDFDVRVPARGHDELAELGRAFNRMADELRAMMAAREELLLGVSHELRTPLSRARLGVEFLPEDPRRDALAADLTEMSALVEELLEFGRLRGNARLDTAAITGEAMLERVRDVVEGIPEAQRAGARIGVSGGSGLRGTRGNVDVAKLARAIRNLVENACAHGGRDAGAASITVTVDTHGAQGNTESGRTLVVSVGDAGTGIDRADAERIFEPFSRLEASRSRRHGGLGLGLALARGFAEAHGGSLTLVRFAPEGALFELRVPFDSARS